MHTSCTDFSLQSRLPTSGVGSGVGGGGVGAGVARRRRGSFLGLSATERSILTVSVPAPALDRPANLSLLASTDASDVDNNKDINIFVKSIILQNRKTHTKSA